MQRRTPPGPRRGPARRVNAPIRRPREGSTIPDLLFAVTAATWTMALMLAVLTLWSDDVGGGDAGVTLARAFAVALAITGLAVFLLGVSILGDARNRADHYFVPMLLGAAIGAAEVYLFFLPATTLLILPPILFIFALRPVRRGMGALFGRGGRR